MGCVVAVALTDVAIFRLSAKPFVSFEGHSFSESAKVYGWPISVSFGKGTKGNP